LRLARKFDIQSREVYSLGSLLGELGGVSGALSTVSNIIVWVLVRNYLYSTVASKIYRYEKKGKYK